MPAVILIIDDSPTLRSQLSEMLGKSGLAATVVETSSVLEGFKYLLKHPVDIVLCDLEMPEMDGLKFLDLHKSRPELRNVPVILLTGREGTEQKIQGLERGASDYVTKPFDSGELVARVKVHLKIKSLQDDLKERNRLLEELSNTDALTQLANRRQLMSILAQEFQRSQRAKHPLSLIMVDIDHFKSINDTFGHQQGDVVLKTVAGTLRSALREYDLASRFGGEEFAMILPETDILHATQVAERVRNMVAHLKFDGPLAKLQMTISLGVATFPDKNIKNIEDLIRLADDALYAAKREGRNRVVFAG